MPPNLGGFFMVRSYYPSECHADYFDFERIEALKPAIVAGGISTLSQSPMLGFHKQMDNRIKLLEEILSFRMQGVEFDNGDMYVDGHKAASDVRAEFVSVTEKLMDELAQCYNVLPQLDINNTIDHRPEGDEKWFLENEKSVTPRCKMRLKKRLLAFSRRLHARIRKTRYMHKMRCLLINRRSLLLALRLLWKTPIFPSNSRFPRLCA